MVLFWLLFFLLSPLNLDNIKYIVYDDIREVVAMTEHIRILLVKRGNISEAELARRLGMKQARRCSA
jgi:hypothetical protein